jgi:hypothetical protein
MWGVVLLSKECTGYIIHNPFILLASMHPFIIQRMYRLLHVQVADQITEIHREK